MAHRHKRRKNKAEQRLITTQQAEIIQFPLDSVEPKRGNMIPGMSIPDRQDLEAMICERYSSAEETTEQMRKEIEKAERQFKGRFPDQEEGDEWDPDDVRIFMKKTMEHAQTIHAHLDGMAAQMNPMVVFRPKPSGLLPLKDEFARAKGREILVDNTLRDSDFKTDVLSRWRWNFLKHPSAYLRVIYDADASQPDLRIEVTDRAALYIDPQLKTGNIRDAEWVIERDWVSLEEAESLIDEGQWHLPGGLDGGFEFDSRPEDEMLRRMIGRHAIDSRHRGPERDRTIEVWHYWQSPGRGRPHAYGVMLGGDRGQLVRYGPNPFPYTGIPYRGKSYLRDPYRPDGVSLAEQYRSIQEVYNTVFNLRIADVLEGVKRQTLVLANLFDEKTEADYANNQRFLRANEAFGQQMLNEGRSLNDFTKELGSGESTQHLLQDLQFLDLEGNKELSTSDVFRGQNPQSGATLGQVQEQLIRSLGVFRPIYGQEMQLVVEVAEIINTYFDDPDFFGEERIISIIGPNRYRQTVPGFSNDEGTGISAKRLPYDEMDVDVTLDAMSQADHLASRTLRFSQFTQLMDAGRHHPELMKEVSKVVNFPAAFTTFLQDSGWDNEAITYTDEEQQQRAQQQEQQRKQSMTEQVQILALGEQAKEKARAERENTVAENKEVLEAQGEIRRQRDMIEQTVTKITEQTQAALDQSRQDHREELDRMRKEHLLIMERMHLEQKLEVSAMKQGVDSSVQTGGNDVNT